MNLGMFIWGMVLIGAAFVGFVYPYYANGATIVQVNDLCVGGLEGLAMFSGATDAIKLCNEARTMTYGIYGSGVIGLVLVVVGIVRREKDD